MRLRLPRRPRVVDTNARGDAAYTAMLRASKLRWNKKTADARLMECGAYGLGLPLAGIFKAAGSGPEVQRFQEEINRGEPTDFTKVEDVNTVSSLLKTFLKRYARGAPSCALWPRSGER